MLRAVAGALLTPFVVASAVAPALAEPVAFGVSDAVVLRDTGGTAGLMLTLSPDSAARFAAFTIANIGRTVAIRIAGKTEMAPSFATRFWAESCGSAAISPATSSTTSPPASCRAPPGLRRK